MSLPAPAHPLPARKQLAALAAARLGLLRAARWWWRRPGLLVVAYHRIGDAGQTALDPDLFTATPRVLAAQVRLFQRARRVVRLEEVVDRCARGREFTDPAVLLTFDDVYRDNLSEALPVLREAGAPAVFFVPTGFLERRCLPWWDRLAYAVRHARGPELRVDYPEPLAVSLHSPGAAALRLHRCVKRNPDLDRERFVAAVEAAAGCRAADDARVSEQFCSWKELEILRDAGMELASHTHTHPLLDHLPYERQREELERSKALLHERLGIDTRALAYPVGSRSRFNADTRRALRDTGYVAAFSNYGGWNPTLADPLDLRRVGIERHISPHLVHATAAAPWVFAS